MRITHTKFDFMSYAAFHLFFHESLDYDIIRAKKGLISMDGREVRRDMVEVSKRDKKKKLVIYCAGESACCSVITAIALEFSHYEEIYVKYNEGPYMTLVHSKNARHKIGECVKVDLVPWNLKIS